MQMLREILETDYKIRQQIEVSGDNAKKKTLLLCFARHGAALFELVPSLQ